MSEGIEIKLVPMDNHQDIRRALAVVWFNLSTALFAQCRSKAGKWLKQGYITEIELEEHFMGENEIIIFFDNTGGMCSASAGVTYHMAELILAHNSEKLAKRLKSLGWILATDFGTVEEIQSKQDSLYFEYNGMFYGIQLPVDDLSDIDRHIIADSRSEIIFDELPTKQKKLIETMIKNKSCQSPVSKKIAKGTFKHMTLYY